ncbi:conserved hypothetical protein [Candidatus Sulfopaludibacter sp. SbA3]|nr:conserved hypothetical protein [Candidatus Sulfopaludibacter sp. SbA3]
MGSTTIVRSEPAVSDREEGIRPRRDEIRAQLARLLASSLFNHSKHYPSLLRHVVSETLEGRGGQLKERALGVEVFGRDPDYDTNADPVVRTSACEVRKRIAQYYHEAGHEFEVRIDLPAGTYVPEFHFPATRPRPPAAVKPSETVPVWVRRTAQRKWVLAAVAGSVVVLVTGAFALRSTPGAVESFWGPVWGSADSVMLAIGSPPLAEPLPPVAVGADPGPTFRDVMKNDGMAFSDALTMARLTGLTREYAKKKLDIRRAAAFTLTDLRKGPVILVGAFNNSWTMRLDDDLRFTYQMNTYTHVGMIRDRQNPSNHSWVHDPSVLYASISQDYAVVSRFLDPLTEKMVVVVAGMGRDGTIAAGEFVTEPRYLEKLASRAPAHWDRKNLQVVLATDIVKGNTGPPRILATYFW